MKLLIVNQDEVERLLPMSDCITVMTDALMALAKGHVHLPLRMVVRPPEAAGVLALMPAYVSGENAAFGVKIIGVFNGNPAHWQRLTSRRGAVAQRRDRRAAGVDERLRDYGDSHCRRVRRGDARAGASRVRRPSHHRVGRAGPIASGGDDVCALDPAGARRQPQSRARAAVCPGYARGLSVSDRSRRTRSRPPCAMPI